MNYSWSPANSLSNPNLPNPVANPSTSTTYTVTVTDANGCLDTDDVFIEVIENPAPPALPGLPEYCSDENIPSISVNGN